MIQTPRGGRQKPGKGGPFHGIHTSPSGVGERWSLSLSPCPEVEV